MLCNFRPSLQRPSAVFHVQAGSPLQSAVCVTFRLDGAAQKEAQDDATSLNMRTQDQIGLDLLTDGEQRRTGFINHILAAFDGIDLTHEATADLSAPRPQSARCLVLSERLRGASRRSLTICALPRRKHQADQDGGAGTHDGDRQHPR